MRSLSRRNLFKAVAAVGASPIAGAYADTLNRPSASEIKLGLVTYNVAKNWDLATIIKNCNAAGIQGVEFRTTHAHGIEPTLSKSERNNIKQQVKDSNLVQISIGTVCEFQSRNEEEVARNMNSAMKSVDLAKDIGARAIKVRPNGIPANSDLNAVLRQIGESLQKLGAYGSDNGVEIWMEVHGGTTQIPENSKMIMDFCGHKNVGVTWNSNATDVIDSSVKKSFELLKGHIRCCHINDLWGSYPYREFFNLLNSIQYDRFTLCEVGTPVAPEDGALFLNCYRGLWKELTR